MINFLGIHLNAFFLMAGLACAAVPLIIHLLNRRRYRVVEWAAMDFLRQALQRNRRIMQLRDLLLLALRTLAVLLFGLALAQPLWHKRAQDEFDPSNRKPLHAVMIVDNSLSMGYETADQENLLDHAKERAKQFVNELPSGSRVTVVPLCGTPGSYSLDAYRTADDATSAIDQIEVVDRATNVSYAADVARQVAQDDSGLAQRVVFLSDQQRGNWEGRLNAESLKQYPEMQVVDVSADEPENSWISDFRMEDEIADVETMANFTVRLRHQGMTSRKDVQVTLWINGEKAVPKSIDLEPGTAEQEVVFQPKFEDFDVDVKPGETTYVPVEVEISADEHDRLLSDNRRFLAVPVVSALPVVFVDELGARDENRALNRYGETWQLRRWLVPIVDRNDTSRQLVRIVHVALDELDQTTLEEARLVVVAGVEDPTSKVELLREYVQQGGQLLVAAGGEFDPGAWNSAAWLKGQGILPAPLKSDLVGQIPGMDGAEFEWFELQYDATLRSHSLFKLADESDSDLAALYSEPFFFQAVQVADADEVESDLAGETERLTEQFEALATAASRTKQFDKLESNAAIDEEHRAQRDADQLLIDELSPRWLKWAEHDALQDELAELAGDEEALRKHAEKVARQERPQVLARFDNGVPYLVERRVGRGRVVFASSGVKPKWNTLARTNAMLLFDRLLRGMLNSTVPSRNQVTQDSISLPVAGSTSDLQFELRRPAPAGETLEPEPLSVGFIGSQTRGLTIHDPLRQGIYEVTAYRGPQSADSGATREKVWETVLAVNVGEGEESDLSALPREEFEERLAGEEVPLTWVGANESISLDGSTIRGQNWWKILAFVVLALLLVEIAVLAWPAVSAERSPSVSDASYSDARPAS